MPNVSALCKWCGEYNISTKECARCKAAICPRCAKKHARECIEKTLEADLAEARERIRSGRGTMRRLETLLFGWSWQVWTEDDYPGPHWEFWMKCCPRCFKGPLTGKPDAVHELCEDCEAAYRKSITDSIGWLPVASTSFLGDALKEAEHIIGEHVSKAAIDALNEKIAKSLARDLTRVEDGLLCINCGERHFSTKPCKWCKARFCLPCQRSHGSLCKPPKAKPKTAETDDF